MTAFIERSARINRGWDDKILSCMHGEETRRHDGQIHVYLLSWRASWCKHAPRRALVYFAGMLRKNPFLLPVLLGPCKNMPFAG